MRNWIQALVVVVGLSGCTFLGQLAPGAPSPSATSATTGGPSNPTTGKSVNNVVVSPSSFNLAVGTSQTLIAQVDYTDGTKDSSVVWSSSDSSVAQVNSTTGVVTAEAQGAVTIVAQSTSDPSKQAVVDVTVSPGSTNAAVVSVSPSSASITVGQSLTLSGSETLSNGQSDGNVTWQSNNTAVAVVTGTGGTATVVGKAAGTATITATSQTDSTVHASAAITVAQ